MQVKELHNENGPSNPWVFVVPRPLSAGMRDDGKRSGLNVLISGEITHEVGAGREVEGQTASVQWQICIHQREKVARREINHNPVCVFVSRFRHNRLADFCIYRPGVGCINPPSSDTRLYKRIQTLVWTYITHQNIFTFFGKHLVIFLQRRLSGDKKHISYLRL